MTYKKPICEICNINVSIGVASSTLGPMSMAMCSTCVENHAEPEWLFKYILKETKGNVSEHVQDLSTFVDGKYILWNDWLKMPDEEIH